MISSPALEHIQYGIAQAQGNYKEAHRLVDTSDTSDSLRKTVLLEGQPLRIASPVQQHAPQAHHAPQYCAYLPVKANWCTNCHVWVYTVISKGRPPHDAQVPTKRNQAQHTPHPHAGPLSGPTWLTNCHVRIDINLHPMRVLCTLQRQVTASCSKGWLVPVNQGLNLQGRRDGQKATQNDTTYTCCPSAACAAQKPNCKCV